ncbi:hypothetical protein Tco_0661994 [Tanacetum coccineum]
MYRGANIQLKYPANSDNIYLLWTTMQISNTGPLFEQNPAFASTTLSRPLGCSFPASVGIHYLGDCDWVCHYWGALFWYEERVKALPKGAAPQAMSGLKVPITIAVTSEGGSNVALAIGCANKLLLEFNNQVNQLTLTSTQRIDLV